jgi:hypothetical protein
MASGKRNAIVLAIEQRVDADPIMEKVAGEHGILCVKITDWKMKRSESVILPERQIKAWQKEIRCKIRI